MSCRLVLFALVMSIPTALLAQGVSGEPRVERTTIEDRGVKIEELRVRGQLQRVIVTPKGGAKPYEIVAPDGARDTSVDANNNRGAAGKRVWHVLSF